MRGMGPSRFKYSILLISIVTQFPEKIRNGSRAYAAGGVSALPGRRGGGKGGWLPVHAVVAEDDAEGAIATLTEGRTGGLMRALRGVGVRELDRPGAENLEAVVEVLAGRERLHAEAGAGIVDLQQGDGLAGGIDDRCLDGGRVTADGCQSQ